MGPSAAAAAADSVGAALEGCSTFWLEIWSLGKVLDEKSPPALLDRSHLFLFGMLVTMDACCW